MTDSGSGSRWSSFAYSELRDEIDLNKRLVRELQDHGRTLRNDKYYVLEPGQYRNEVSDPLDRLFGYRQELYDEIEFRKKQAVELRADRERQRQEQQEARERRRQEQQEARERWQAEKAQREQEQREARERIRHEQQDARERKRVEREQREQEQQEAREQRRAEREQERADHQRGNEQYHNNYENQPAVRADRPRPRPGNRPSLSPRPAAFRAKTDTSLHRAMADGPFRAPIAAILTWAHDIARLNVVPGVEPEVFVMTLVLSTYRYLARYEDGELYVWAEVPADTAGAQVLDGVYYLPANNQDDIAVLNEIGDWWEDD